MKYYNIQLDLIAELRNQTINKRAWFDPRDWNLDDVAQLEEITRFLKTEITQYRATKKKFESDGVAQSYRINP